MPSVWTVGDVHGATALLEALLGALPRGDEDTTVFIGDYIDRGPDSAAVVRRVLAEHDAAPERTVLLWGNHEDMAAEHWKLPAPSGWSYDPFDWFRNGGIETMQSYGSSRPRLFTDPCPPELQRLFGLLRLFWRSDHPELAPYVWVHAGLPPGKTPEESPQSELVWIRNEFLNVEDRSGRIVVHGHTPFQAVRVRRDKIGIDTGAVYGGALTALQLPERRVYQVDAAGNCIDYDLPTV
jgi:serine/threonine protein phosphatase 1